MRTIFLSLFILTNSSVFAMSDSLNTVSRDSIVQYARMHLGTPYLWGGTSNKGFDCSGFVYYVFHHFKIAVSRTSRGFKDKGEDRDLEQAKPGDIILFTGTNSAVRQIGHVGIITENRDGSVKFIHSSSSKKHYGVTETNYTNSNGYQKRFLKVINILL